MLDTLSMHHASTFHFTETFRKKLRQYQRLDMMMTVCNDANSYNRDLNTCPLLRLTIDLHNIPPLACQEPPMLAPLVNEVEDAGGITGTCWVGGEAISA